jgi:hypothetical protein
MTSEARPSNIKETRTIEIELTSELRDILNDQNQIQAEMKYNVSEIPYNKYIEAMTKIEGGDSNITNKLLRQLFSTHPEFDKIKETLILATFRTTLTTDNGLNGETNFHTDNLLFPGEKDSNLIITWGLGTEAASIDLTRLIEDVRQKVMVLVFNDNNTSIDIKSFFTFKSNILEKTLDERNRVIEEYKSINLATETDSFKKIVKEVYDKLIQEREELNLNILSSSSPNASGNITALIMSGKEVYHRRITTPEIQATPIYRYVLNIFFNASDLQPVKTPGGKKKRQSTRKKRTKRRHMKTR